MNKNKPAVTMKKVVAIIQILCGVSTLFTFGLATLILLFADEEGLEPAIVIGVVFSVLGFWLIYSGRKKWKMVQQFKNYVGHLSADPSRSLSNLASETNSSIDEIRKNIENMTRNGLFANGNINYDTNCMSFSTKTVTTTTTSETGMRGTGMNGSGLETPQKSVKSSPSQDTYKLVVCKGCGATNKILEGTVGECEFCGSKLE